MKKFTERRIIAQTYILRKKRHEKLTFTFSSNSKWIYKHIPITNQEKILYILCIMYQNIYKKKNPIEFKISLVHLSD